MPRRKSPGKVPPIERFPPRPRADGRYQKRIRGVLHYFGSGGDRASALAEYDAVKRDLYAGRQPNSPAQGREPTLKEIVNRFGDERDQEVAAGRLNPAWNKQGERAIVRFATFIGGGRSVSSLTPDDFARYGRHLSELLGAHAFNRERQSVVTMLRHAADCDWIDRAVKLGKGFRKISAAVIREERRWRLVDSFTIALLLFSVPPQLEIVLLLAVNAGFGATDCCLLQWRHIDFGNAIIAHYRRPKTSITRDAPLWPETMEALSARRRLVPDDDPYVLRTKYGNPWTAIGIAHRLAVHVDALSSDVVLGDLRHTFLTYANETMDGDAVKRIAGHRLPGLKDIYVETLFHPRLRLVVDHVRRRVFSGLASGPAPGHSSPPPPAASSG